MSHRRFPTNPEYSEKVKIQMNMLYSYAKKVFIKFIIIKRIPFSVHVERVCSAGDHISELESVATRDKYFEKM